MMTTLLLDDQAISLDDFNKRCAHDPEIAVLLMGAKAGEVIRFEDPDGTEHRLERPVIYWRLRNGTYGLKGPGAPPPTGQPVKVLLRDGEVRVERMGRVVFAEPGVVWIATTEASAQAALAPQRTPLAEGPTARSQAIKDGRTEDGIAQAMRIAAARAQLSPRERMSITGSYHGHGGRCRSCPATATVGAFCARCASRDDH